MWVKIREYAAVFEAEMDRARLEGGGIEVMIQSPAPGIFGAGYSGTTSQGVSLLVPEDQVGAARELIDDSEPSGA